MPNILVISCLVHKIQCFRCYSILAHLTCIWIIILRWVASKDCHGCRNAGIANYFDCSSSITCKPTRNIINLKYGTGEATTYLFTDDIKIGNMKAQG